MSENKSEYLVDVRELKEYFPVKTGFFKKIPLKAVDGVSFHIKEGETLGLVGESGCGKTTVGRTLLRLYEPTGGEFYFNGELVTAKNIGPLRRQMQMVFQDPYSSLDPRMTVEDIIGEPLDVHHLYSGKAERHDKVLHLMELVGLNAEHATRYAHEFSGGQRQRIGIARALAVNPKFIVCDEPVSALDVSIQAQILNLLQDLQKEKKLAYMFITHDMSVVKHISDHIMVMYVGVVVETSPSKALFQQPLHPYTKGLLSAIPVPSIHTEKKRIIMQGELTSPVDPKPGCRFANRCPYAKEKCRAEVPAYEEVLPDHFAACHYIREINHL